ncbi:MAG: ankyrin repeat domain-containing protein, partial [Thermoanaerobaculia bacterium]|nr:ankyrin repeat domain-containing protein [Thermoanaerobaculia bacterium]
MALLFALPAPQVEAQGIGAPPPSLERLLQAARTGDVAGVERALASGAPIDGGDPKRGETALMRAAAFGQRATVQTLLSAGANPMAESAGKRTALHAAAE